MRMPIFIVAYTKSKRVADAHAAPYFLLLAPCSRDDAFKSLTMMAVMWRWCGGVPDQIDEDGGDKNGVCEWSRHRHDRTDGFDGQNSPLNVDSNEFIVLSGVLADAIR